MKRIRILCGICKVVKHYGIARGMKKVSNIMACENCRHFYLKLKKNPFEMDCISPMKGSCYQKCSFMKTRCKCCWAMQLLDSCPHSDTFYNTLSDFLGGGCKKLIRGIPLTLDDIEEEARGTATVEEYENDEWVESPTSQEEIEKLLSLEDDDGEDDEGQSGPAKVVERSLRNSDRGTNKNSSKESILSMADLALDGDDEIDVEEEEAAVDDPAAMEVDNSKNVIDMRGRASKTSERIKRKRKKVEYFTKPVVGRKAKGPIYGSDGKLTKTGMDLCDCLQEECVGCHFPCPKCRSPKCGNECRVNRRWYYEKVEVEGTKLFWINKWVPKI